MGPKGREGAAPTHLPSAVAALPGQVLPMDQSARGPAALQREPGVDKRGGAGVVINKESLEKEKEFTANVLVWLVLVFTVSKVNICPGSRVHSLM